MFKIDEDFLLSTEYAKDLYHNYAKKQPIIDFHNHLSAEVIYKNEQCADAGALFLEGDHYKWRALRTFGISEDEITNQTNFEKLFTKYCEIMPRLIGNPLYHWTYLELKQYFACSSYVNKENSKKIFDHCNQVIVNENYTPRKLLEMANVESLCTTDDPIDDLKYHALLQEEGIQCLPTFRPDKIINMDRSGFDEYMKQLEEVVGFSINDCKSMSKALEMRVKFFVENGCRISDHALDRVEYDNDFEQLDSIIANRDLTGLAKYKTFILSTLAELYVKYGVVQQYHIGAARDASKSKFQTLGPDTGFDYISDEPFIHNLASLLSLQDENNSLPKTIIYPLNSIYYESVTTLMGCFQSDYPGKIQLGSGWWFNDQLDGMKRQFEVLSQMGVLSLFVGMVTDSRSYLSFPRHEYFRRLLCEHFGQLMANGQITHEIKEVAPIIEDICYGNIKRYLNLTEK